MRLLFEGLHCIEGCTTLSTTLCLLMTVDCINHHTFVSSCTDSTDTRDVSILLGNEFSWKTKLWPKNPQELWARNICRLWLNIQDGTIMAASLLVDLMIASSWCGLCKLDPPLNHKNICWARLNLGIRAIFFMEYFFLMTNYNCWVVLQTARWFFHFFFGLASLFLFAEPLLYG